MRMPVRNAQRLAVSTVCLSLAAAWACGGDRATFDRLPPTPVPTHTDSDAGSGDGGLPDGGDGGASDAGDAGRPDGGDGGASDAGDAGLFDGGAADGGDGGPQAGGDAGCPDLANRVVQAFDRCSSVPGTRTASLGGSCADAFLFLDTQPFCEGTISGPDASFAGSCRSGALGCTAASLPGTLHCREPSGTVRDAGCDITLCSANDLAPCHP